MFPILRPGTTRMRCGNLGASRLCGGSILCLILLGFFEDSSHWGAAALRVSCELEVDKACSDYLPGGRQMGECLQNPDLHKRKTIITTRCEHFIKLNQICEKDIDKFCEKQHF